MNTLKNKVSLIGRLGQNPELKKTGSKSETPYLRISLATNENYKNTKGEWVDNTQWHNLIIWGKTAERMATIASKGQEVLIEGRLKQSVYGEGDNKKYSTDVEVMEFLLLSSKNADQSKNVESTKK